MHDPERTSHDRKAADETSHAGSACRATAGAGRVRTEKPKQRRPRPSRQGGGGPGVRAVHARQRCARLSRPGRQRTVARPRPREGERPEVPSRAGEVPHSGPRRRTRKIRPSLSGAAAAVLAVHAGQRCARLPRPGRQRAVARHWPRAARRPEVRGRDADLPPKAAGRRRPSMRPKLLITGAAVVVLGGAAAGLALAWGSAAKEPAAKPLLPPATEKVARTTLVETKKVPGTLGYADPTPISAAGTGTLTWIAPVGSTVKRGEPLFKVDERPVVALYGALPLYRTLRTGVKGTDVKQLKENLSKLGNTGFTVDDTYTAATAQAARRWQADLGLPQTGAVEPGQLVVAPGAVRVAEHTARVGDLLGGDSGGGAGGGASVLSYTGTTRLVTVQLEVADQALAIKCRTVTVTVPGRGPVKGRIAQVGTVATAPEQTGNAPADQASKAPGGSTSTAADARIQVTVTIADQKKVRFAGRRPGGCGLHQPRTQGRPGGPGRGAARAARRRLR